MKCPCCSQELPQIDKLRFADHGHRIIRYGTAIRLSPLEYRIAKAVRYRRMPMSDLVDAVYGDDPDGGPTAPDKCIHTLEARANKKLKAIGLRVGAEEPCANGTLHGIWDI